MGGTNAARALGAASAFAFFFCACSSRSRSPFVGDYGEPAGAPSEEGGIAIEGDAGRNRPPPDAAGSCPGSTYLDAITDRPNLYFVLDRSGSMLDLIDGQEKYTALRIAVVGLVRGLGARANIGVALFPSPTESGCAPGAEVFTTRQGEPAISSTVDSAVTHAFAVATNQPPVSGGGTPTAATLAGLTPTLRALPGRTVVILATDGGPNCDLSAACSADQCMPNIEQVPGCGNVNCCDPPNPDDPSDPRVGPSSCLDGAPTLAAIRALRASGIPTYVIGLPSAASQAGSDVYASMLDQMAIAGGTARDGTGDADGSAGTTTPPAGGDGSAPGHQYYAVRQIAELDDALRAISGKVALTCHVTLAAPPADRNLINVYLDQNLLAYDPVDGWGWASDGGIELYGAACSALEGGDVEKVQVVAGCPIHVK